jgi:hypothetical protein
MHSILVFCGTGRGGLSDFQPKATEGLLTGTCAPSLPFTMSWLEPGLWFAKRLGLVDGDAGGPGGDCLGQSRPVLIGPWPVLASGLRF